MLMIVPCNHTKLYSSILMNIFDHQLLEYNECGHNHNHNQSKDSKDNHSHHSCTPFCTCGISVFVLNAPPNRLAIVKESRSIQPADIIQSTFWAATNNEYSNLMLNDIWRPPQRI